MKVSTRGHYGLRAMVFLAHEHQRGPVALGEIARSEAIPPAYLEQIMAALRRAGLVDATRGARGGYHLSADPTLITAGEVLRALEGPLAFTECASEAADPGCCQRETTCPSRPLWERVRLSVAQVLDSTTLANLCAQGEASGEKVAPVQEALLQRGRK